MATVSQLLRHPVKSLTPEPVESIELTSDGRVLGDRVLGFRFKNAGDSSDWTWQTKHNFVGLVNTPGLATLTVQFDKDSGFLSIHAGDLLIVDCQIANAESRRQAEAQFTDYVLTLSDNPLTDHPERYPVNLVGNGDQPVFHDTAAGLVTLHSETSLHALAESFGNSEIDGRRFRSNIVVSGLSEAFEEMSWIGRRISVGNSEFKVIKPVNRCLVTHVNPVTGQRDRDVMNLLVDNFTPEKPQFAVMLQVTDGDRSVALGDEIRLLD